MRFGYPVQAQHRKYRIVRSGRDTNRQKTRIFVHQHIHMRACTRHACPDREGGSLARIVPIPAKDKASRPAIGFKSASWQSRRPSRVASCISPAHRKRNAVELASHPSHVCRCWEGRERYCVASIWLQGDNPSGCKATHTARPRSVEMECDVTCGRAV
ncbi:hypothetical protein BGZ61DRAFT_83696 [Ilyonectria robusta]|uniref:uncharacterized protein n=1 Tax=Ilyonectria robusta TaxID=1079257 RepID=UPI001E8CF22B|nr:uncharacterized protein BGZ61DRAFT_83696 [Ilyonectria robusta]KAH8735700.1 hypothetical protein BGZ61DRAFT_83696 [Ilyonectria robusta]